MVWLCPPQPSSIPVHASGRDHLKADSGAEVEATKQKGKQQSNYENLVHYNNLQIVSSF